MCKHPIKDIKVIDELVNPTVVRGPTSLHTGKFFAFVNFEDVEGATAARPWRRPIPGGPAARPPQN